MRMTCAAEPLFVALAAKLVRPLACAQRAKHTEATQPYAREHRFEGLCRAQLREHGGPTHLLSF